MTYKKIYPFSTDLVFKKVVSTQVGAAERIYHLATEQDIKVHSIDEEYTVDASKDSRSIRLDIRVISDKGILDLEMQNKNYDNIVMRSRYYISAIDVMESQKGKDFTYDDLPEVIVIFICMFDPWGDNIPRYSSTERLFKNLFYLEDSEDISKRKNYYARYAKIILNAAYTGDEEGPLIDFLHYVYDTEEMKPRDPFTEELQSSVIDVNESDGVKIMTEEMKMRLERKDGYKEGIEVGALENAKKNALSMLQDNMSEELVSKYTGLSLEEIKKLHEMI